MIELILHSITLLIAIVALYRTFKPADKIELKIHDDLSDLKTNTRGVEIKSIEKVNNDRVTYISSCRKCGKILKTKEPIYYDETIMCKKCADKLAEERKLGTIALDKDGIARSLDHLI